MARTGNAQISLALGALAPSIAEQLASQGLEAPSAVLFDKIRVSLCTLRIQGYIADSAHAKGCQKLVNAVAKEARPLTWPEGGARP